MAAGFPSARREAAVAWVREYAARIKPLPDGKLPLAVITVRRRD
ncbi:MAG: hypothetical protein ACM3ZC_05665 [Bacteroidota bacterium]